MSPKQPNGVNGLAAATEQTAFPLEKLSWEITKNASIVSQHLHASHLPQPSPEADGPSVVLPNDSPQGVQQARQKLISSALELLQLAVGPSEFLPNLATGFQYISCLTWLCQYNIFHLVPLQGTIGYGDLAAAAGIPEARLRSVVRMAMTGGLFREHTDSDGSQHVGHSATSALLASNEDVYAYATYMCTRSAPMAMQMAAAAQRWGPGTTRTYETAYNVAFDTDLPFFDHLSRDESKMQEFAAYMKNVRSSDGVHLKHLLSGFSWQEIPDAGVVVDVGGSTGSSAIALAKAFPHLSFVVQDLPANAESGRKAAAETLPDKISSRITFQGRDFFAGPQPVLGADVYLVRMILHDWPDDKAAEILRNIVPAMEGEKGKRSRLLIMDTVLPKPGSVPVSVERIVRARDLTMMQAFNSNERDLEDWKKLLAYADARLRLAGVVQPFGSAMSILEVVIS